MLLHVLLEVERVTELFIAVRAVEPGFVFVCHEMVVETMLPGERRLAY